jgi:hypothetical protein
MFTGRGVEYLAGIRSRVLGYRVKAKSAILSAVALVVTLVSISAAQAQCSATGSLQGSPLNPTGGDGGCGLTQAISLIGIRRGCIFLRRGSVCAKTRTRF